MELETQLQSDSSSGDIQSAFSIQSIQSIQKTYGLPMVELIEKAHRIHRSCFDPMTIQTSRLLSIKTGGCPEDCAYCPQSAHYKTGVQKEDLMEVNEVIFEAQRAKAEGATRFCMGAAWREVRDGPQFNRVLEMVRRISSMDMEVCCTLGMLKKHQAQQLKDAGLYAYNHNIDCSEDFYEKVISTRQFQDRLKTLSHVREAGITVCTGGILGLGEAHKDRIHFLHQLVKMNPQPESVTINTLVAIEGTPLAKQKPVETLDVVRVIATARVHMPNSMIRLSAGRINMTSAEQLLCFYAGANSIFLGERLLTSPNPEVSKDQKLFEDLSLKPMEPMECLKTPSVESSLN